MQGREITILNGIVKGLLQWLYGLCWEAGEAVMNVLMDVFSMDMDYFKTAVPVSESILDIMFGIGWALLLGNLVFQAAKSMMTGLGFEGEDPQTLAARTLVFTFLLVASRQTCEIGLSLCATVTDLLKMPKSVTLPALPEEVFSIDADWVIILIIGIVLIIHLVKFFFEVGERYVIVGVLTILAPLAFAMGGSRNTMDIFKGWARMYGSMCLMMAMNVVFLKLIVSAMAIFPRGLTIFPWLILVIALARVSRKIDSIIARIGLNPAITGDGLGRGFPGAMALMVGKSIASQFIGGKMSMGKAAASSAKGTVAGMGAKASGFAAGASPAPSPINTCPHPINPPVGMGSTGGRAAQTNGIPSNPPLGRTNIGGRTSAQPLRSSQKSVTGGALSSRINANSQSVQRGTGTQNNPLSLQNTLQTGAPIQTTQQGAQINNRTNHQTAAHAVSGRGAQPVQTANGANARGGTSSILQAPAGKKAIPPSPNPPSRLPEKTPKAVDFPMRDKQSKPTQDRAKKSGNPGQRQVPEPIDIGTNANAGDAALGLPPETMVTEDE